MKALIILLALISLLLVSCSGSGSKTTYSIRGVVAGEGELAGIVVKLYSLQYEQEGRLLAIDTTDAVGAYQVSALTCEEPLFRVECSDPLLVYKTYEENLLDFSDALQTGGSFLLERDFLLQKR